MGCVGGTSAAQALPGLCTQDTVPVPLNPRAGPACADRARGALSRPRAPLARLPRAACSQRSPRRAGPGRAPHLRRKRSRHTFPRGWHASRSRRQVHDTRPMSAAPSTSQQRISSSSSPGRSVRPIPSGSGPPGAAAAGPGLSAAAMLAVYLPGEGLGSVCRFRRRAKAEERPRERLPSAAAPESAERSEAALSPM